MGWRGGGITFSGCSFWRSEWGGWKICIFCGTGRGPYPKRGTYNDWRRRRERRRSRRKRGGGGMLVPDVASLTRRWAGNLNTMAQCTDRDVCGLDIHLESFPAKLIEKRPFREAPDGDEPNGSRFLLLLPRLGRSWETIPPLVEWKKQTVP